MKKNKILFIAYYFPPIKAIGSMRPYFFAKFFKKSNWDVTIFTTSAYKFFNKEDLPKLSGIQYKYLPTFDLQVMKRVIKNKQKEVIHKQVTQKNSKIKKMRGSFPLNILYEGGLLYIIFGVLFGLIKVKRDKVENIFSTYSPYSNHIIAYFIKLFHPSCYWVADFRDLPYGISSQEIYFTKFQNKLNQLICQKADKIITISDGLKESFERYTKNVEVLTNGFCGQFEEQIKIKPSQKNIFYSGSLYNGVRDASIVFEVVKELLDEKKISDSVRLIYAGNDAFLWKYWAQLYQLENYIEVKGYLSREETIKLQNEASINLMLTWSNQYEKGILTGKLYEYLMALNPIVCIINGEEDSEITKRFKRLNCGVSYVSTSKQEIKQEIENILNTTKEYKYNKDELMKYSYENIALQLEKIYLGKENVFN